MAEDLAQGRSLALAMPARPPDGWLDALRQALRDRASLEVERMSANGDAPLAQLASRFAGADAANLPALVVAPAFAGQCVAILDVPGEHWAAWCALLTQFEVATRGCSLFARPRLLVAGGAVALSSPPAPQPGLIAHRWNGAAAPLDLRLYAAILFEEAAGPPWQRQLAAAVSAELALWDPELCEFCRRLTLADLLDPLVPLQNWAAERCWSAEDPAMNEAAAWHLGCRHECDGQPREHAAWLALRGDQASLAQRVWSAQVGVLFPLLERHRQSLIGRWPRRLTVPYTTPSGQRIEDRRDLELAHIAAQWRGLTDMRREREFAVWLRDLRNCLAHGEPVAADVLQSPMWQERFGRPEQ
ncbi:MAG: hypothetical protein ABJF10_06285 [Chthoniobacter sp.]|uniref:hypothetical protein n=1 Tax=Chthoniobacter sp. TaxID=2510640 RepID=UPI0032A5B385